MANISTELDSMLLSPNFIEDPYPTYEALRSNDPVHWSDAWGCWLLTRHADCDAVLRDTRRFTNVGRIARFLDTLPSADREDAKPLYDHFAAGLNHSDPPDHTRIRALVIKAFTPGSVRRLQSRIEALVHELIDHVVPAGGMDLIADFAYPLPAIITGEMLGFPDKDRPRFKAWSDAIVAFHGTGRADPSTVRRSREALLEARAWLAGLVEQRRREPRDDLLSALALARQQGKGLTEVELFSTCITFMVGGHETTTNLIGNGMLALLRHPDQLQRLSRDDDLLEPAVEELLRYDAPAQRAQRLAREDMQVNGRRIKRGQLVQPVLGAANRDPARFVDPDRLDIARRENPHLAFGTGTHFCTGAALARLEGRIALGALLRRLANIKLRDPDAIAWSPNSFFRGLKALHLDFDERHS